MITKRPMRASRDIIMYLDSVVMPEIREKIASIKGKPPKKYIKSKRDARFSYKLCGYRLKNKMVWRCFDVRVVDGDYCVIIANPEDTIKFEKQEIQKVSESPEPATTGDPLRGYSEYLKAQFDKLNDALVEYKECVRIYPCEILSSRGYEKCIGVQEINPISKRYVSIEIFENRIESYWVNAYTNWGYKIHSADDVVAFIKDFFASRLKESGEIAQAAKKIVSDVKNWRLLMIKREFPNREMSATTPLEHWYYHKDYPNILVPSARDMQTMGGRVGFVERSFIENNNGKTYYDNIYIAALKDAIALRDQYEKSIETLKTCGVTVV